MPGGAGAAHRPGRPGRGASRTRAWPRRSRCRRWCWGRRAGRGWGSRGRSRRGRREDVAQASASVPCGPSISSGATNSCDLKPVARTSTSAARSRPPARMPPGVTVSIAVGDELDVVAYERRVPVVGEHDPLAAERVSRRDLPPQRRVVDRRAGSACAPPPSCGTSSQLVARHAVRAELVEGPDRRAVELLQRREALEGALGSLGVGEVHFRDRPARRALVDVDLAAVPAIAGTTWIALQPVPSTATRRPARSTSWRQRAVWNAGPAKESSPAAPGRSGPSSWPQAGIRTSALNGPRRSSPASSARPRSGPSAPRSRCARPAAARAPRGRPGSPACGAKRRDQRGFGAKENSYRCEGMSHAAPG